MDVMEAIHARRSVRDFAATPVDDESLEGLIKAAVQAPSAMNTQPWRFTVIRGADRLSAISREAKAHQLALASEAHLPAELLDRLRDPSFNIFYNAPVLVVISAREAGAWAAIDCALAAQNLMLAARAAGLGSCWVGLAQGWLATADGKVLIGVFADDTPIAPIILGHPVAFPPPVERHAPQIDWGH